MPGRAIRHSPRALGARSRADRDDAWDGRTLLSQRLRVSSGDSTDVVLHLPVDPAGDPLVTTFDNPDEPVPADKAELVVAHTAAVPPADIRVDGKVLFSNVASGEALELVVPAGTYSVDIVPTGKNGPTVLGRSTSTCAAAGARGRGGGRLVGRQCRTR